jgi:hypothetical protein
VAIQDANAHLAAWGQFYWQRGASQIRIEGRPQQAVTLAIDTDLFRKNESIPWRQIGSIQAGMVLWKVPPLSGQEKVDDYMERALR